MSHETDQLSPLAKHDGEHDLTSANSDNIENDEDNNVLDLSFKVKYMGDATKSIEKNNNFLKINTNAQHNNKRKKKPTKSETLLLKEVDAKNGEDHFGSVLSRRSNSACSNSSSNTASENEEIDQESAKIFTDNAEEEHVEREEGFEEEYCNNTFPNNEIEDDTSVLKSEYCEYSNNCEREETPPGSSFIKHQHVDANFYDELNDAVDYKENQNKHLKATKNSKIPNANKKRQVSHSNSQMNDSMSTMSYFQISADAKNSHHSQELLNNLSPHSNLNQINTSNTTQNTAANSSSKKQMRFQCCFCIYKSHSVSLMQNHIYRHIDTTPYSCYYCGHKSTTKSTIMVHIELCHPNMEVNLTLFTPFLL